MRERVCLFVDKKFTKVRLRLMRDRERFLSHKYKLIWYVYNKVKRKKEGHTINKTVGKHCELIRSYELKGWAIYICMAWVFYGFEEMKSMMIKRPYEKF